MFFFTAVLVVLASMSGCHNALESAGSVTWDGIPLRTERETPNPSDSLLHEEGFSTPLVPSSEHFFALRPQSLQGEIKLLEFGKDIEAYAAFQHLADPSELADGFAVRGGRVFFRKGCWLGALPESGRDKEWLQSKLHLPGNEEWGALPEVFSSLLHQGRVLHSERVMVDRFLGVETSTPVFTVSLDCHGDSAWIYAAPGMSTHFSQGMIKRSGYRMDYEGMDTLVIGDSGLGGPLILDFFKEGMVGVEGCFDTVLTNRWIQTQEKALKSFKTGKKFKISGIIPKFDDLSRI